MRSTALGAGVVVGTGAAFMSLPVVLSLRLTGDSLTVAVCLTTDPFLKNSWLCFFRTFRQLYMQAPYQLQLIENTVIVFGNHAASSAK